MSEVKNQVEAILFASGRKMQLEEISRLCRTRDQEAVKEALKRLQREYEERQGPLIVVGEGDVWNLTVREKYLPLVQKIVTETELSRSVMETLAVIAWKQPVLQSDIIKIRTNKAYDHIHQLEDMGFLTSKKKGRTKELRLTETFFKYFDLQGDKDIREFFKDVQPQKTEEEPESGQPESQEQLKPGEPAAQDNPEHPSQEKEPEGSGASQEQSTEQPEKKEPEKEPSEEKS